MKRFKAILRDTWWLWLVFLGMGTGLGVFFEPVFFCLLSDRDRDILLLHDDAIRRKRKSSRGPLGLTTFFGGDHRDAILHKTHHEPLQPSR